MPPTKPTRVGRYALHDVIASGGAAAVHLGRAMGDDGFSRVVAVKRLHRELTHQPDFVAMLRDEARLTARIRHPHVVSITDVVTDDDEVLLVMEYIHGLALSQLLREAKSRGEAIPSSVVTAILIPALRGLHAAHSAIGSDGEPLHLVHRDVSPQNILVDTDGMTHVVDFGVAKARGRVQTTELGHVKGKPSYMAPEQIMDTDVDARVDVFAAGIVAWELLTLRRLFEGSNPMAICRRVMTAPIDEPSRVARLGRPAPELDAVVMKSLEREPDARWSSAAAFADALGEACPPDTTTEVARWFRTLAEETMTERSAQLARVDRAAMPPATQADRGEAPSVRETDPSSRMPDADGATRVMATMPFDDADHHAAASPPPRRGRAIAAVTALAALAIGAWLAVTATSSPTSPASATEPTDAAPTDAVPSDAVPSDEAPTDEGPSPTETSAPSSPAENPAGTSPPATATAASGPVSPPPATAPPRPPAPPPLPTPPASSKCKLVATRDARGVKVFERQCP